METEVNYAIGRIEEKVGEKFVISFHPPVRFGYEGKIYLVERLKYNISYITERFKIDPEHPQMTDLLFEKKGLVDEIINKAKKLGKPVSFLVPTLEKVMEDGMGMEREESD